MHILQNISGHDDLVQLNDKQREQLCAEIRNFLVESVSKTGGHLASNLGAVELTVAIETVFNTANDRLVFDVGHQSYVHKLLTGRQTDFERLRKFGGISGFPKPSESAADAFVAGHASSSVSIALGMARARTLQGQNYDVVAVIGDGAATGGMAYEGLNDAAMSKEPMIIILNDNEMSIDRNVGGMAWHLSQIRSSDSYLSLKVKYRKVLNRIPGGRFLYKFSSWVKNRLKRLVLPSTLFENMGLTYLGPVDGHDLEDLIDLLRAARELRAPVLVHVLTQKGYGYGPAMANPAKFHGIGPFDPVSGESLSGKTRTFSDGFGETMLELAETTLNLCAITAAMPTGTGLTEFQSSYPQRTFDVGIAEEHAVSMAGGLAKQGMVPVVALYSTFLQRSFDQIMQDIAMLRLHVVLAIDRAGLVGDDGETHHGIYDVGFLRQVPGMRILCPVSIGEQAAMLRWAVSEYDGPVAVRYPRGGNGSYTGSDWNGSASVRCHRQGSDVTLITYGTILDNVLDGAERLSKAGIEAKVLRMLDISLQDISEIREQILHGKPVIVIEEVANRSGICQELSYELHKGGIAQVFGLDLGHRFVTHGTKAELYKHYKLDGQSIADYTLGVLGCEN